MKKAVFIVNPESGASRKKNIGEEIVSCLDMDGGSYEIVYTQRPKHASELALNAVKEGVPVVVAVGGDGTVNEVASSMVGSSSAMGIVPIGSGNGLARHLGIPQDVKKAVRKILEERTAAIDYGLLNRKKFFCTCGCGFDAEVGYKFGGKRGRSSYVKTVMKEFFRYSPSNYEIENSEGNTVFSSKAFLITAANAGQWGNDAYVAPGASVQDGLLDLVVVEPFSVLAAASLSWRLFHRSLQKSKKVRIFRDNAFTIRRSEAGLVHLDGEPMFSPAELEISVCPKGLKVIV
ncbi:MAG: YegS/Rv2252/BmrU family lipid kinase [Bacteroidales bacterium]|nr:YegS/Rv2252/BmrU family lipid kinase [Bacteroidales bacterium]